LHDDQDQAIALAVESLKAFRREYDAAWAAGMHAKLGLPSGLDESVAGGLVEEVTSMLRESHPDFTSFFRGLITAAAGDPEPVRSLMLDLPRFDTWLEQWRSLGPDPEAMARVNPVYIPRNHLVEEALDAANDGDLEPLNALLSAVTSPYHERPGLERYAEPGPEDFAARYRTFCGT